MRKHCGLFAVLAAALCVALAFPAAGRAGQPAPTPKKLRLAFLLLGEAQDKGWNQAHVEGVQYLKKRLGDRITVTVVENASDPQTTANVLREYAQKGYDMIFATTFDHGGPLYAVAKKYPKVRFMHCSGERRLPNLGTYMVRIEQSEYLAGYAAGLMGFNNVGTVATVPIPEVFRGVNAFTLGLERGLRESKTKFDPERLNTVVWMNSWDDAAKAKKLAGQLAAKGHDLIRQMADTPETAQVACSRGVPTVGYGMDVARFGAPCALTSTTFEWGPIYVDIVRSLLAGTWKSSAIFAGFESGGAGLAPFSRRVPQSIVAKVLAQRAHMVRGQDESFAGPVTDQSGRVRIPAGGKATDAELLGMNWFVRGVRTTLPAKAPAK